MELHNMDRRWIVGGAVAAVTGTFAGGFVYYKRSSATEAQAAAQAVSESIKIARAGAPVFGGASAKVEIVEFFDPACEACKAFYPAVKQIINSSFGRVKLQLRYAPLHKGSDIAAKMLEAANLQGKYWPAVEAALIAQDAWASHDNPNVELLWAVFKEIGLDVDRMRKDVNAPEIQAVLDQDLAAIQALKVNKTPTFFVNDSPLLDFGADQLRALVAQKVNAAYGS
jgi:protein-disulfide isomerase